MAPRSLNPNASENIAQRLAGKTPPTEPPRRNFLMAFFAGAIGTLIALFPLGAGLLPFLDPLLKKRKKEDGSDKQGRMLRVASVGSVPSDGTPVQVPVIADLVDAWSGEPNQPIGAVYLRKDGDKIICYNAICPHAGCFVGFDAGRRCFQCPCHTSAFELTGERIGESSPSPRDLDPLEVDEDKLKEGEIWIRFQNFYPGKAEREAKS